MSIAALDWRDAASYAWLEAGDRRCFAWEWLRRTPDYMAAWLTDASVEPFGLLSPVDPALDARLARPMWGPDWDAGVLSGRIGAARAGSGIDLSPMWPWATVHADGITTHVLLSNGLCSIRLDLSGEAWLGFPVDVVWSIPSGQGVQQKIASLAQFAALDRMGRFAHSLHPPQKRRQRWILMLRTHDAVMAGATLRDLVSGLFGIDTTAIRWRAASGPWRLRAQRLRAGARACLTLGSRSWLSPASP